MPKAESKAALTVSIYTPSRATWFLFTSLIYVLFTSDLWHPRCISPKCVVFGLAAVIRMEPFIIIANQGGISSSVLSVFFTDKFALSQSDARISVAYNSCRWKTLTKRLMKCPPGRITQALGSSALLWQKEASDIPSKSEILNVFAFYPVCSSSRPNFMNKYSSC